MKIKTLSHWIIKKDKCVCIYGINKIYTDFVDVNNIATPAFNQSSVLLALDSKQGFEITPAETCNQL